MRMIIGVRRIFRKTAAFILIICTIFLVSTIYDNYKFTQAGMGGIEYRSFSDLMEMNPDIAAWIRIEGTNIDHPVVQGRDNYEYLGKDVNGNDYAGGSIFLDSGNSRNLSDNYIIIHGHHMSGGAMFGDLANFCIEEFFNEHSEGELLTPDSKYDLTIVGAAVEDAYDGNVYYTDPDRRPLELLETCSITRAADFEENDKLVALSTCFGDMSNKRTVIFARARYAGRNNQ